MTAPLPKFRRRKDTRPAEIVQAALDVFADKGFAAARMDDIAQRAGVSKGALYLYFATKADLFRAVAEAGIGAGITASTALAAASDLDPVSLIRLILERISGVAETGRYGAVLQMVVGESRQFPELARIWHDMVVARGVSLLTSVIASAQASGQVRAGDPRLYAIGLISPVITSLIWGEVFGPVGAAPLPMPTLMRQHVETALRGMLSPPGEMRR